MCGRFTLRPMPKELAEYFELSREPEWSPRYNIAPIDSADRLAARTTTQFTPERRRSPHRSHCRQLRISPGRVDHCQSAISPRSRLSASKTMTDHQHKIYSLLRPPLRHHYPPV